MYLFLPWGSGSQTYYMTHIPLHFLCFTLICVPSSPSQILNTRITDSSCSLVRPPVLFLFYFSNFFFILSILCLQFFIRVLTTSLVASSSLHWIPTSWGGKVDEVLFLRKRPHSFCLQCLFQLWQLDSMVDLMSTTLVSEKGVATSKGQRGVY